MSGHPAAGLEGSEFSARDVEQIEAIFTDMAAGFNARNVAHADRHFTSDATLVVPDGRRVVGLDALLRYHERRLGGPASRWQTRYRVLSVSRIDQRTAIVHTAQGVTTADGSFENHGTFVVVERSGSWWIAAAHNTNVENEGGPTDGVQDTS